MVYGGFVDGEGGCNEMGGMGCESEMEKPVDCERQKRKMIIFMGSQSWDWRQDVVQRYFIFFS